MGELLKGKWSLEKEVMGEGIPSLNLYSVNIFFSEQGVFLFITPDYLFFPKLYVSLLPEL